MSDKDIQALREALIRMRQDQSGQMAHLTADAVEDHESSNREEDGTDAFDREFAFKLAGSKRDLLVQIDDALQRINDGTYSQCETCGDRIGKARMKALPFVRQCIHCQAKSEQGRTNGRTPRA